MNELSQEQRDWFNQLPTEVAFCEYPDCHLKKCPVCDTANIPTCYAEHALGELVRWIQIHYGHRNIAGITDTPLYICRDCETSIYPAAEEKGIALLEQHGSHDYSNYEGKPPKADSPLLSILCFVLPDVVWLKPEHGTDRLDASRPWFSMIRQGTAYQMYRYPFDQIKDDLNKFVEAMDDKRPVPRKEMVVINGLPRHEWNVYIRDTVTWVDGRAMEAFEEYVGQTIPIYAPNKFIQKWEQLYPREYDLSIISPSWHDEIWNDTTPELRGHIVDWTATVLETVTRSQSEAFEVWRYEITEAK